MIIIIILSVLENRITIKRPFICLAVVDRAERVNTVYFDLCNIFEVLFFLLLRYARTGVLSFSFGG